MLQFLPRVFVIIIVASISNEIPGRLVQSMKISTFYPLINQFAINWCPFALSPLLIPPQKIPVVSLSLSITFL